MNPSNEPLSLCVGRWLGFDVRIHILLPIVVLSSLLLTKDFNGIPIESESVITTDGLLIPHTLGGVDARLVCLAIGVLFFSVSLQEVARLIAAKRVGGDATSLVLGPIGGLTKIHLPADPPAHLLTGLIGPSVSVIFMLIAGFLLALNGDSKVLQLLFSPLDPNIVYPATGVGLLSLKLICQLVLWINCCLFLINLLPVDPCAGAEILRGVLWPVVGRSTATSATSHVAIGAAVLLAISSALLVGNTPNGDLVPNWFPLALASVFLLFSGRNILPSKNYDVGLEIDSFDSDDEIWLTDLIEEDHAAVLVENIQDKQQDAIDRKRREREANEDARVDAILARLHGSSFENLSEEERAFLKRASRRYQRRRGVTEDKLL
ncbi:hypothetical protein [Bythopirellula polymerisocia]|uniref:Peptidase family M50 n=1 Tax=Bythopirellula polymerisocia TaxID=2528003 RepID=A0A5C6CVV4_9BACT|nr:hypothetical protein [Bythopirellula polymerisocia]TWU28568.1 Peptidase family M50 [Bythopirellula polymerisocia]